MVIGESSNSQDIYLNPCVKRQATNIRAVGADEKIVLAALWRIVRRYGGWRGCGGSTEECEEVDSGRQQADEDEKGSPQRLIDHGAGSGGKDRLSLDRRYKILNSHGPSKFLSAVDIGCELDCL